MHGERAKQFRRIESDCHTCKQVTYNQTGTKECSRAEGCNESERRAKVNVSHPIPELDRDAWMVLRFFNETAPALWSSGMGVGHVPRNELREECNARGHDMSEFLLEKYAICERALREVQKKQKDEESEAEP